MRTALVFVRSAETMSLIERSLGDGFRILTCSDPEDAHERTLRERVDILLVDLGFEGEAGFRFGEVTRGESRLLPVPLIFLSSIRDTAQTVKAFQVGGDDLVHVPFAPEELQARIEARFRRIQVGPIVHDLFWKADLRFSLGTQRVVCTDATGERDLELTPNEFKILYHLARNEAVTLSRKAILSEVWGESLHVVERTVDKHICALRRKMAERSSYVVSVPGAGYSFNPAGFQVTALSALSSVNQFRMTAHDEVESGAQ